MRCPLVRFVRARSSEAVEEGQRTRRVRQRASRLILRRLHLQQQTLRWRKVVCLDLLAHRDKGRRKEGCDVRHQL